MDHMRMPTIPDGARMIKVSQRPAKSCTECIRRKTRCDKRIPCEPCRRRGVEHICNRESQFRYENLPDVPPAPSINSGTSRPPNAAEDPEEHVSTERDRINHILSELASLRKRVTDLESRQGVQHSARRGQDVQSVEHEGVDRDEPADAATTLEFLALGLDRRLEATSASHSGSARASEGAHRGGGLKSFLLPTAHLDPPDSPSQIPDIVLSSILPRKATDSILRKAQSKGEWQHCCVSFPSFFKQMDTFWSIVDPAVGSLDDGDLESRWCRLDGTWIGLLYVLMGIGVHQMSEADALACGLSDADRYILPSAFIQAAMSSLENASFLSKPTMWTVQAIAILTLCGHNVCESDLLSSLLAVGIKTGQTLGLHSLGGASARLNLSARQGMDTKEQQVAIETGKRVWWGLVQEDWFAIPFRGVWSIHVEHFDTPLPSCTDAGNLAVDSHNLAVAFKSHFSSQVALVVQDVFTKLRRSDNHPYQVAESAALQIRSLLDTLPPTLKGTPVNSPVPLPSWVSAMRHYLVISATHKILIVYRASLSRDTRMTSHERRKANAACTAAAHDIVNELERGGREEGVLQSLWTIPYHGLAAGVVLGLDLIALLARQAGGRRNNGEERDDLISQRRSGVRMARDGLARLAATSRIARRGLQVLADLMKEADMYADGRKKGGHLAEIARRIKLPANEMMDTPATSPEPTVEDLQTTSPIGSRPSQDAEGAMNSGLWTPDKDTAGATSDGRDLAPTEAYAMDMSSLDIQEFMRTLQETAPDVMRLFDGSLGDFTM